MTAIEVLIVLGLVVAAVLVISFAAVSVLCVWAVVRALRSPDWVGRRKP